MNKKPNLHEQYKRLVAGTWTLYVDWNATSPVGIWHYECHNPNRNSPHEHWTLFKSGMRNENEVMDLIMGEIGQAIVYHICEVNELWDLVNY